MQSKTLTCCVFIDPFPDDSILIAEAMFVDEAADLSGPPCSEGTAGPPDSFRSISLEDDAQVTVEAPAVDLEDFSSDTDPYSLPISYDWVDVELGLGPQSPERSPSPRRLSFVPRLNLPALSSLTSSLSGSLSASSPPGRRVPVVELDV